MEGRSGKEQGQGKGRMGLRGEGKKNRDFCILLT